MFPGFCNGHSGVFQVFISTVASPPLMIFLCALLALLPSAICATVTYDFNITWVSSNPDGAHVRPTIGINGQWPLPAITANVGDRIIVNVFNGLGNQSTSLHFHGLFMKNASHMDGPAQVTQCGIPPGSSFQYNFTVWCACRGLYEIIEITRFSVNRWINQVHTGIILTLNRNILTDCGVR